MKNIHQLLKPSFTINPSFLTTIEEEQMKCSLVIHKSQFLNITISKKFLLKGVQVLAKH